ncbi:MAG: hypothetical protein IRZ04_12315 [Rhodospirillales bacterium]|nr:hypothetical protein [Rhodospirillales bacterium]
MPLKLPILVAFFALATPVAAQVLNDPQDVARCLCAESAVKTLGDELAVRKRIYDDARQQLQSIDRDLEQRRQTINVNDEAQVNAFRERFDQRSALAARLSGEIDADYRTAVERYNRAVAQYNEGCIGRVLDANVVNSVRPTLVCPAP